MLTVRDQTVPSTHLASPSLHVSTYVHKAQPNAFSDGNYLHVHGSDAKPNIIISVKNQRERQIRRCTVLDLNGEAAINIKTVAEKPSASGVNVVPCRNVSQGAAGLPQANYSVGIDRLALILTNYEWN